MSKCFVERTRWLRYGRRTKSIAYTSILRVGVTRYFFSEYSKRSVGSCEQVYTVKLHVWRKTMRTNQEINSRTCVTVGGKCFCSYNQRHVLATSWMHSAVGATRYTRLPASNGCHAKHSDLDVECIFCLAEHFCNVLRVNGDECNNTKKEKHPLSAGIECLC